MLPILHPAQTNGDISEIMLHPCEHRGNGCPRFVVSEDIISHGITCSYRKIRCRVLEDFPCEWIGTYMKLKPHIRARHGNTIITKSDNFKVSWDEEMPKEAVMIVQVFGKIFYLFRETNSTDITWAFQFIGEYPSHYKYRYQMKVFSDNTKIPPITYPTMEVHDIKDCLEQMADGYCMFKKAAINHFKAANGVIQFKIVVTNI